MDGNPRSLLLERDYAIILIMTEPLKKIMEELEKLSGKEQAQLVDAILTQQKKKRGKSVLDLIGIHHGGKALYSRLDRDSIYEK